MSRLVELKLRDFGVEVEVVAVHPGPVITRFEMEPAPGVKASKISNLAKDLARSMAVSAVRRGVRSTLRIGICVVVEPGRRSRPVQLVSRLDLATR